MNIPVKASAVDLYENIMGSAWETWSWWTQVKDDIGREDVPDGWKVTGRVDDPKEPEDSNPGMDFEINAEKLRSALEKISGDEKINADFRRKCLGLLIDPDNADFDASDGDFVIQVAVFGENVYS